MKNGDNKGDQIFEAIVSTLKKIKHLNSTMQAVKATDEPDELSISSLERIKTQLANDLSGLLATFDIEVKIKAKAV